MRLAFRAGAAMALALGASCAAAADAPRMTAGEKAFRAANPCPVTGLTHGRCTAYVVDRIIPIICGGADDPANMRWLTLPEAKAKARWDRIGCRRGRKLVLPGESTSTTEAFATGESAGPVQAHALPPGAAVPPEEPAPAAAEPDASETELPHQ